MATGLHHALARLAGQPVGFVLITFSIGVAESRPSYISNCDRAEMIAAMEEMLGLLKAGMPDVAAHEVAG